MTSGFRLLTGAWARRADVRLVDGLYLALGEQFDLRMLTSDRKLAHVRGSLAETLPAPTT